MATRNILEAYPKDAVGNLVLDATVPVDHPKLLREEISYNAGGYICRQSLFYDLGGGAEQEYRKRIIPVDSDEIVDTVTKHYPWSKI